MVLLATTALGGFPLEPAGEPFGRVIVPEVEPGSWSDVLSDGLVADAVVEELDTPSAPQAASPSIRLLKSALRTCERALKEKLVMITTPVDEHHNRQGSDSRARTTVRSRIALWITAGG